MELLVLAIFGLLLCLLIAKLGPEDFHEPYKDAIDEVNKDISKLVKDFEESRNKQTSDKSRIDSVYEFFQPQPEPAPSTDQNKPTTNLVNPMQYSNQFCSAETKLKYMQSEEWKELKRLRLVMANHCCEVEGCTETENLQLHHVNYERLLAENIEDLRIVCYKHHNLIHQQLGYDRTTLYPIN